MNPQLTIEFPNENSREMFAEMLAEMIPTFEDEGLCVDLTESPERVILYPEEPHED